jgi:hypothetical protein
VSPNPVNLCVGYRSDGWTGRTPFGNITLPTCRCHYDEHWGVVNRAPVVTNAAPFSPVADVTIATSADRAERQEVERSDAADADEFADEQQDKRDILDGIVKILMCLSTQVLRRIYKICQRLAKRFEAAQKATRLERPVENEGDDVELQRLKENWARVHQAQGEAPASSLDAGTQPKGFRIAHTSRKKVDAEGRATSAADSGLHDTTVPEEAKLPTNDEVLEERMQKNLMDARKKEGTQL